MISASPVSFVIFFTSLIEIKISMRNHDVTVASGGDFGTLCVYLPLCNMFSKMDRCIPKDRLKSWPHIPCSFSTNLSADLES